MSSRAPGSESGTTAPTLADVAEMVGVSRATVSRAFGNPGVLRPETVARVRSAAAQIGYRPNPAAQALVTGRTGLLAMIVPDIANPFFPPLISAVESRADSAGLAVLLGNTAEDPLREDALMHKLALQVDGFVLAASRMNEQQVRAYAVRRPVVVINRDVPGIPRVLIDSADGVSAGVEHLAGLGHTRIAYLAGPSRSWANAQREKAIQRTAERVGVQVVVLPGCVSSYAAGMQAVPSLLATGVTAVVAFDDLLAHGIMAGLAARGISVPGDVSLMGCDDVMASEVHPALTTVSAGVAEAGAAAVDLLVQRLDLTATVASDVRILLGTSLVVRASTAPVR